MAFCNLFTNLGDVKGELKDPNHRNNTNNGQEGSLKRKPQTQKSAPYVKRQCPQPYAAGTCDAVRNDEPKADKAHGFNRANNNNNPRPGVSKDATYRHNQRTFTSNGGNGGSANNATNKKKKNMKNKGKKKRERERENGQRYRNAQKDKRNQDNTQPRKPFMSQEFKEQHSLEVDGHLLCIYFLRGRCIKGEECQFKHIEGYNGLIKEACKFYIQGFCLKGKNCPYLHETFPCKFFHTKGNCRRDLCMFSHDPLTDFTRKLLDDFVQRENELRKKAEETLSQTENVSVAVEKNTTVDIVIPTARPSFYCSETAVDTDTSMPNEEQQANVTEDDNTPQTENFAEQKDSLPSALDQPGPVCYSVEAILGPKLFKPCLYTASIQEAPLYDPKTRDNSSSDLINTYSIDNVNSKSTTTPSIAEAAVALSESKDKETSLILDDKYSVLPSLQAKTFRKPSCQDSASGYYNKQCEKSDSKQAFCGAEMECELLQAKEELTATSNKLNSVFKDKNVATDSNRQYTSLMGSSCPSQKYLMPQDKFVGCEHDSNPTPSLKNNYTCSSSTAFKKQITPIQQNLKETHSETSLNAPSSGLKNVTENRKENVASPCNKTTTRLNGLFTSLTPDLHPTSTVNNISGNTTVQIAQNFESDFASQKVSSSIGCSSKNKKEIESHTSPPAKKFHGLSANLILDSDRSTVSERASEKTAVLTALKCSKSVCASKKNSCGSNEAAHSSKPLSTNSKTDNHSKKFVSTSVTGNLKSSNNEEGFESTKTPPAKSCQSLFASLTPDSDWTSTVINSGYKPAVPNSPKVENSICDHQKVKLDSSQTLKPSQCTENTPENPKNSIHSKYMQVEGSTSKQTPSNNNEGLVTSSAKSELNVKNRKDDISAKTCPAKSFHNLFASLTPVSDQMSENTETVKTLSTKSFQNLFASLTQNSGHASTVGCLSDKPATQSAQKVEISICDSQKVDYDLNQVRKQSPKNEESTTSCDNSDSISDLKSKNNKEGIQSVETPIKSFQILFASLMATDNKNFSDNPDALNTHNVEKSKCQNSDSNQVKSTAKQNQFTENLSKSRNNQSSSSYGEVGLVTKRTKTNVQKLNCSSAMSSLKSKNAKDDPDRVKTHASEATKQSQYSESSSSSSSKAAGRIETLNNCQKPVSSSAMSKGENPQTENAKLFHSVSHLGQGGKYDSKVPCLPKLPQCMDGELSHKRHYFASSTENKQTEESDNEPRKKCATTNSSSVSNASPASPQQNNTGLPNSILRTLFQQLQPYEPQEHQVCVKGSIHPG